MPTHNALLSHIAASPSLVVAPLVHCISQPRAFTGKAACSLWCGYRIVYCAIPARDPSIVNVSLLVSGTLSLFQSGVCHIHDHSTPLRCTFTASRICICCAGRVAFMLHTLRICRHTTCTPPACIYIYCSSFYSFCGSLVGASAGIAAWRLPTHIIAHASPNSYFHILNILLLQYHTSYLTHILNTVSRLLLCSAAAPLPL